VRMQILRNKANSGLTVTRLRLRCSFRGTADVRRGVCRSGDRRSREANRQNKPNFCGCPEMGATREGALRGQRCKTNPISRPEGYPTIPSFQRSSPMPIVRNEPNLRGAKNSDNCCSGQGLGEDYADEAPEKTKPIPGGTGRDKAGQAARAAGRTHRAKRTQFADLGPGWSAARTLRLRKTNPIWESPAGARGPVVQNKANQRRLPVRRRGRGKSVCLGGRVR
jgi:hypothetical protein